jgi:hypothetical protein
MNKAFIELKTFMKNIIERFESVRSVGERDCLDCNYPVQKMLSYLRVHDLATEMRAIACNPIADIRNAEVKKFKEHMEAMILEVETAAREHDEKH